MRRRPEGTDGSDYSYRMKVVDKYQKAADARKRAKTLIVLQAVYHLAAFAWSYLPVLDGKHQALAARITHPAGLVAVLTGFSAIKGVTHKGKLRAYEVLSILLSAVALVVTGLGRNTFGPEESAAWIAGKALSGATGLNSGMCMAISQGAEVVLDILGVAGQLMAAYLAHTIIADMGGSGKRS
mmetsp:Transcript_28910/g.92328  ORF Transcript_28910/g.92328 Transcript_28910/m.92328 type:complete len:183 (+) Transcript_28910:955-1503(+)